MGTRKRERDQGASSRLASLIENELTRRGWTAQEAAREAKLPAGRVPNRAERAKAQHRPCRRVVPSPRHHDDDRRRNRARTRDQLAKGAGRSC